MKLDSFDVSVISLQQKNSDDPLCYIMSQFLNRAKMENTKGKSKSIPSSFLFMFSQPLISVKGKEIEEQKDRKMDGTSDLLKVMSNS